MSKRHSFSVLPAEIKNIYFILTTSACDFSYLQLIWDVQ